MIKQLLAEGSTEHCPVSYLKRFWMVDFEDSTRILIESVIAQLKERPLAYKVFLTTDLWADR